MVIDVSMAIIRATGLLPEYKKSNLSAVQLERQPSSVSFCEWNPSTSSVDESQAKQMLKEVIFYTKKEETFDGKK